MVRLKLEKYCEDCLDFDPATERITYHTSNQEIHKCDTSVYCKHRDRCKSVEKYLKMKNENWGNKE